jgi:hypothetical protein
VSLPSTADATEELQERFIDLPWALLLDPVASSLYDDLLAQIGDQSIHDRGRHEPRDRVARAAKEERGLLDAPLGQVGGELPSVDLPTPGARAEPAHERLNEQPVLHDTAVSRLALIESSG